MRSPKFRVDKPVSDHYITPWFLAFTVVGLVLHIMLHQRWWYYLRRDMNRWLLRGTRQ